MTSAVYRVKLEPKGLIEAEASFSATGSMASAITAYLSALAPVEAEPVADDKFWLVVRKPRETPNRKGPWTTEHMANVLREFIAAQPTAYIDVITLGHDGPQVQHGPEALQMLDGRSMSVGRSHNERVRLAEAADPSPTSAENAPVGPSAAGEGWRGQNYANDLRKNVEKALAVATKVLGGPEGGTVLRYTLPSGLWLMLQANARNLLDTLPPAPPPTGEREAALEDWQHDTPFITEVSEPGGKKYVSVAVRTFDALHQAHSIIINAFKSAGAK